LTLSKALDFCPKEEQEENEDLEMSQDSDKPPSPSATFPPPPPPSGSSSSSSASSSINPSCCSEKLTSSSPTKKGSPSDTHLLSNQEPLPKPETPKNDKSFYGLNVNKEDDFNSKISQTKQLTATLYDDTSNQKDTLVLPKKLLDNKNKNEPEVSDLFQLILEMSLKNSSNTCSESQKLTGSDDDVQPSKKLPEMHQEALPKMSETEQPSVSELRYGSKGTFNNR
jgi:hypothetical protein